MPNIQYWLGEVYYANKNFQQAIIEFGKVLQNTRFHKRSR